MQNSKHEKSRKLEKELLHMIHTVFVEIRATDDVSLAKKLADTFHVVPISIANKESDLDDDAIYEGLLKRAKSQGLEEYVRELRKLSQSSI